MFVSAIKTIALAAVVMAGLQGASNAKDLPSKITFGPNSTSPRSLIKPDVSVNEGAVKLAAWHPHLEINKSCDDPSLGTGCGDDDNA